MSRPTKSSYFMTIAGAVAQRSTCLRRRYGAVIVKDGVIVSTGYNGAACGEANCCDVGECYRKANNIPHGENYELCKAVHAEANAIIHGNRADMIGAELYLYGEEDDMPIEAAPCLMCERLIRNAGISKIHVMDFSSEEEQNDDSISLQGLL